MALDPGSRIGPYEVVAPLGSGGMGDVYLALDPRLQREVAIKILPEAFASDAERLARFEREAQLLATLNHPNIAAIYGVEESAGARALVMELVEGATLAARLERGPLPLDEALPVAAQIAAALEVAHERGVIHRDLKPGNIIVAPDGTAKILDFGLAKSIVESASPEDDTPDAATMLRGTRAGMILGTAAYMAPEQAKGRSLDRRADIWAFGCVVYEMLAGRPAFRGETLTDVLAAVVKDEPDWSTLPASTPPRLSRMLRRCLEKDPRRRLRDIGDARLEIEDAISAPARGEAAGLTWRSSRVAAIAAAVVALVAALALRAPWRDASPPPPLLRLGIEPGAAVALPSAIPASERALASSGWLGATVTVSPDGRLMAFVARGVAGGAWQLHVRRFDELTATPLPGTEGAYAPFFSPDGRWIAFFAPGRLMKVPSNGGAAVKLCDAEEARGGWWSEDGTIVFAPRTEGGLKRVSSEGGSPAALTRLDEAAGEVTHRWPQVLPGGKTILFTAQVRATSYNDAILVAQELPDGPRKVVHRGGFYGRYLPSGHLTWIRDRKLFAAPFDPERLELEGRPVAVLDDVAHALINGGAEVSFSNTGMLLYRRTQNRKAVIDWLDLDGQTRPLHGVPGDYREIRFAPDGSRLAIEASDGLQSDLWIYELASETMSRLTFYTDNDSSPIWTSDGRRVAWSSWRADTGTTNLFWQSADGAGEAERLTTSRNRQHAFSWHPSGEALAFGELRPETGWDVMILPVGAGGATGEPAAFASMPANEAIAAFSPDGRWLAYVSDESGRSEVFVRPFPGPGGLWQVSTDGAAWVEWSPTRNELYYGTAEETVMVVSWRAEGSSFRAERPRLWIRMPPDYNWVAPHPEGTRAAIIRSDEVRRDALVLLVGFFDELRRVAVRDR